MELINLGGHHDLDQASRHHTLNAARNLVDSSVLLTDLMRDGRLQVEAGLLQPAHHDDRLDGGGDADALGSPAHMPVMQ